MQASSEASALVASDVLAHDPRARKDKALLDRSTLHLTAAFLLLAALMLSRAFRFWLFTLDDAFITLRYARHLAQGLGPSWNPGAAPAEGYTTLSWMLLLSLAEFLHIDGPWFAKAMGVVFALASFLAAALLAQRACRAAGLSARAQALALGAVLALFASYWPISLHAVSGMETTLSCFVLTAFFLQSTKLASSPSAADVLLTCRKLALAALACCLTRPEAVLPCAVTLLALLSSPATPRRALVHSCALYLVLPFAAYYGLRWQHFGLLFPLSFYVKAVGQPLFTGLPDVIDFFAPFVGEQPWWSIFFVFGALHARALRASFLGALSLALFFVFPEHIMAFEGRYLLPIFPFMAATAAVGVAELGERLLARPALRSLPLRSALAVLGLCLLAALPLPAGPLARAQQWLDYGRSLRAAHVALAHDLASARSQGGRIALLDVGAIGYYADWYTIDTFGLNDAHVALSRRSDVDYVFAQRPDLLVLVSAQPRHFKEVFAWETPLYEAARQRHYQTLCDYEFESDYYLQVLGRPDPAAIRGKVCASAGHFSPD